MTTLTAENNISSFPFQYNESARGTSAAANYVLSSPRSVEFAVRLGGGKVVQFTLIGSGHEPARLWRDLNAIKRIGALAPNWDSYGGKSLNPLAVRRWVERVLPTILTDGVPEPEYFPTSDGGLQIEWHSGSADVEIVIPPTGAIEYLIVDSVVGEKEGNFEPEEVIPALRRLGANVT